MTTTFNVDSNAAYVQALETNTRASLVHAADLLAELTEIQCFLLSSAFAALSADCYDVLHGRQEELLSRVSLLVAHYLDGTAQI